MSPAGAATVAALTGCACMGVELTAVRLLAPSFGDSAYVWTNVIGVILLALALGAWVGGRWSARPHGSPLRTLLLVAAGWTALVPWFGPWLGGSLLPADMPLDAAMPALVRGSLVASALLFGPPVWLLGALSPGLVAAVAAGGQPVGRVAGTLSAAGTIGSLVGTFAATHVLVPSFGCRATLWLCALLLALAAVVLRADRRAAAVALLVGAAVLLPRGPLRAPPAGSELLAERETRAQYLQVVRTPDSQRGARTELKINEGLDSYHSVAVEGTVFTGGGYYDWHAIAPLLAGDGVRPVDLRVLSIGDAAGTFRRIYDAVHPGAIVDAVELDDEAVRLGEQFFGSRRAPGRVFAPLDGRVFVARSREQWDVVHVDAYAHQVYIPAHLASVEFFTAVRARLRPNGVVACNVGGLGADDPVVVAIGRTLAAVFGDAAALHVPDSRNLLLVARASAQPIDPRVLARWQPGQERLDAKDAAAWQALVAAAAEPSAWTHFAAATAPLVDDRPELDRLLHASYVARRDAAEPIAIGGPDSVASAEGAAHQARLGKDARAVLAAAARAQAPSAYLRFLCGDARWQLRELHGASAEYAAAASLAPTEELASTLQQRQRDLASELQPHAAAEAAGARNGWLAAAAVAALIAVSALLARRA